MTDLNPNTPPWTPTAGRPPMISAQGGRITLRQVDFKSIAWCMDACQGLGGPVDSGALKAVTEALEDARRELESINQVRNGSFYRNPRMDAAIAMVRGDDPARGGVEPEPDWVAEYEALLHQCRSALDVVLEREPDLAAVTFGDSQDTVGNLRASLGDFSAQGSTPFRAIPELPDSVTEADYGWLQIARGEVALEDRGWVLRAIARDVLEGKA
ncbi:hypothetical protein TK90_2716 (plasmid) [Thioalkalivibrio sp. K90mix]|uniref:hypothetical protein n=1 Tax=Thioalkalivibrio sp. (strain K90mix) TaxID=396595 RepID=UPI000195A4D3|nr:hypothetical protein [Thioalkalivibrio sp. K90mix]ADC73202.1 hypothetical protein TK90_2716 [Thioalkalivibrio sp. K90mix]